MAKSYTLQGSLNGGTHQNWSSTDLSWVNFSAYSAKQAGRGNGDRYLATNILFSSSILNQLRSKTVTSIKLTLTITQGNIYTEDTFARQLIGYKLNNIASTDSAGTAWQRSDADSTASSDTIYAGQVLAGNVMNITSPTNVTFDLSGSRVPKYGYVIGPSRETLLEFSSITISAATLVVVTNETDYTLTLSYNANGGSGAPGSQSYTVTTTGTPTHTFAISSVIPVRSGFTFVGWKYGNSVYQPGSSITITSSTTLYAVWSPAQSSITSVTDPVSIDGSTAVVVNINRNNNSYTHDVMITLGNRSVTLTDQGTTATFVIPTLWLDQLPSSVSGTAVVEVRTKSGSTQIGSAVSKTFTVNVPASVVPSVSLTSDDVNSNTAFNSWNVLVKGYSKIKLDVTASPGNGSELYSIAFSGDGVSKTSLQTSVTSSVLQVTGSRTWAVVVTDKRGRSTRKTVTRTVYSYAIPDVTSLTAFRSNSSGSAAPSDGTYISAKAIYTYSSVNNLNSIQTKVLSYKRRLDSNYTTGISSANSNTDYVFGSGNISLLYVYDVKITITDAVGYTATKIVSVSSVSGISFGLKNDRARFGGPVQKPGFQVDWPTEINSTFDVTPRRVYATLSSAGWYRVMKYTADNQDLACGMVGAIIDFTITRQRVTSGEDNHFIRMMMVKDDIVFYDETSHSLSGYQRFTKIRYTNAGSIGYVDIYYDGGNSHAEVDFVVHTRPGIQNAFTAESFQVVDSSPANETVLVSYNFSANTRGYEVATKNSNFNASTFTLTATRRGDLIVYYFNISVPALAAATETTMGTFSTLKPPSGFNLTTCGQSGGAFLIQFKASGAITIYATNATTGQFVRGSFVIPV